MMKLVTAGTVTHTHTQCNLKEIKRAENKTALLWIY